MVFDYENGRASAAELAKLYGILGSNTISDWVRKYGKLNSKNSMSPSPIEKSSKEKRKRRQRSYEQLRISELEIELEEIRLRLKLYVCALDVASKATGIDLLKKTGELLYKQQMSKK